jgi:hypothetical protein
METVLIDLVTVTVFEDGIVALDIPERWTTKRLLRWLERNRDHPELRLAMLAIEMEVLKRRIADLEK